MHLWILWMDVNGLSSAASLRKSEASGVHPRLEEMFAITTGRRCFNFAVFTSNSQVVKWEARFKFAKCILCKLDSRLSLIVSLALLDCIQAHGTTKIDSTEQTARRYVQAYWRGAFLAGFPCIKGCFNALMVKVRSFQESLVALGNIFYAPARKPWGSLEGNPEICHQGATARS